MKSNNPPRKVQTITRNMPALPRVLVLTSTFPRWQNDTEPGFVFELSRRLTDEFNITVLAPRSPGAKDEEIMAGMRIKRFGYFFRPLENLATHSGGIMGRLWANPFNYLLVPFFLLGQILALARLLKNENFDLIHAHWIIPQGLAAHTALALTRKKTPVVCTSHGGDMYASIYFELFSFSESHLFRFGINCTLCG